uniref:Uncharacterized protein n=1 Tax=Seriola dumerili TaxID=41447 RepID=A0A3B4UW87_SERDU
IEVLKCNQASRLRSDLALSHQENRELQERLMVSEATVHAQAEQLKDYRDLLSEIWVMRLVVVVRTKLREKTPAAQVTNRFKSLSNHDK